MRCPNVKGKIPDSGALGTHTREGEWTRALEEF